MLALGVVAIPHSHNRHDNLLLLVACRSEQGIPGCSAVLSSDDFGSSVERTATLHPLWRVVVREASSRLEELARAGLNQRFSLRCLAGWEEISLAMPSLLHAPGL